MRQNKPIKIFLFLIILIVISIGVLMTIQYIQSRKTIKVNFSNIANIRLVEFRTLKPASIISKSGEKITISKNVRYKITYKGTDGYANGELILDNRKDNITIKPYYSFEKLDSLLTDIDVISLHSKIRDMYLPDTLNSYTIQKGRLYHFGDWYSTSLVYNGEYNEVSDTLHVVAKKTIQGWKIITDPNITFDRFNNPTIPVDILQSINDSISFLSA